MKIALLAPLWKKVPPEKYGGTELVVANLAKGLVELGHEVTTFACGGSDVPGKLVSVIEKPMHELVGGFNWSGIQPYEFLSYFELGKRLKDFDIIHNHVGFHPIALSPFLPMSMLTTLHSSLPPDFPYLAEAFKAYPFVSISDAQRNLSPELNYIATVYHGINTGSFEPCLDIAEGSFVFMGTLSHNKGLDIAVRSAKELGEKLIIAGEIRDEDKEFLEEKVLPHVDGTQIRFIGEADHKMKNKLFSEAKAVLFPSRWNEAFGLVMIEALACGAPVVALNNGAVPEVIKNGETGFVVNDELKFSEAMGRIGEISRKTCRTEAEDKFDISVMAKNYEIVYGSLLKNGD